MCETQRATAREIAHKHLVAGDPLGWFEDLYIGVGNRMEPKAFPEIIRIVYRCGLVLCTTRMEGNV